MLETEFTRRKNDASFKYLKSLAIIIISLHFILTNKKKRKIIIDINSEDYIMSINKNFSDLLPRINLSDNKVPKLKDIFKAREIYINDNNITNEYIRYIRPVNESEEDIYREKLYPDLQFNELFKITRSDQYDVKDFHELCQKGILLDKNTYPLSDRPLISFVLPSYNKEKDLLKSVRSIQNQSFKDIEIIIMDDCSNDYSKNIFSYLLDTEPRIRIFHHLKNLGCWRSRMDGFLYSNGKYIQHFDTGDIYIDNYVIEDIFSYVDKYKLDSVRFSFQWVACNNVSHDNYRKVFSPEYTKIRYGHVEYRLATFGFGTIWNRLTRANIYSKGLDLVDEYILNAYKNLWEDAWWNQMANVISSSHLTVNRVGYCYFPSYMGEGMLKVNSRLREEKAIREFIYFWLFDYQILPKDNNKASVIQEMKKFIEPENRVRGKIVLISYLKTEFPIYEHFLNTLLNDTYITESDKDFVRELLSNYTKIKKHKKRKKKKK